MAAVTAPLSSFSSSGPSVEWCMPICCTILIVLPEELLKLRNSGSVGALASTPTAKKRTGISHILNVLQVGVLLELHCNYPSPEVCVEDVSGLVTGGMSQVASDLVTENDNKHRNERLVLFMSW